jgi:hypothetical protein
MKVPAEN